MIPYFEFTSFTIGPLTVQVWGLLAVLGFAAALWVAYRTARSRGLSAPALLDLGFWVILAALVGARFFFVINHWSFFTDDPLAALRVWEGGESFFGGLAFGSLAGFIFLKRRRLPFLPFADVVFAALPLGYAIGRIGCFLIHDHLGRPTNFFLGVEYGGITRHETSLYAIIYGLLIFALLRVVLNRVWFRSRPGSLTALFLISYGAIRFGVDFLRATDLPGADLRWWGLTGGQFLAAALFVTGGLLLSRIIKQTKAGLR